MTEPTPPATTDPALRARTIVISGPSGAGKTTIAVSLLRDPRFGRARTATTRAPRAGERDGADYDFLTDVEFASGLERGAFVEHADVYGRRYGTPRANLDEVLASGRHCVLVVDVQGARALRDLGLEALFVFVTAPSLEELRQRLEGRGKDDPDEIERRIAAAKHELEQADLFDMTLVNDDVVAATQRLASRAGVDWSPLED